jgi:para-aminobenzoate synthetase component 2
VAATVLVIDNYDSFVYNLVQYLSELGAEPVVRRNDETGPDEVRDLRPAGVLISPGPGRPEDAGVSVALVRELAGSVPVLGVCLGHQAVACAFGGKVGRAVALLHGKATQVSHDARGIFAGLPNPFLAARYHSLAVDREVLPAELEVSAWAPDGTVMGLRHRSCAVDGVQFHPESVLTEGGYHLLANWLALCGLPTALEAAKALPSRIAATRPTP